MTNSMTTKRQAEIKAVYTEIMRINNDNRYSKSNKKRLIKHWLHYIYDKGASAIIEALNDGFNTDK